MTEGRGDFREYDWNEVIYGSLKRGSGWFVLQRGRQRGGMLCEIDFVYLE